MPSSRVEVAAMTVSLGFGEGGFRLAAFGCGGSAEDSDEWER